MRFLTIAVGVTVIVPTAIGIALAGPPPPGVVAPDIVKAIGDWTTCRGSKVGRLVGTSRSSDSIVDEALEACGEYEQIFRKVWLKHYGPNSAGQVQAMRARWREGLIAQVNSIRKGTPLTNEPARVWGICVGNHIPNPTPANIASEVIADSAMAACSSELEKVRAEVAQKQGVAVAANHVEQLRVEMRKRAIALVEDGREHH